MQYTITCEEVFGNVSFLRWSIPLSLYWHRVGLGGHNVNAWLGLDRQEELYRRCGICDLCCLDGWTGQAGFLFMNSDAKDLAAMKNTPENKEINNFIIVFATFPEIP